MAGVEVKNVNSPDETRSFGGKGEGGVLDVGGHPVLYGTFEPGWKWSEHIKPIAGTEKCEATHLIYRFSGRMKVVHDDGSEGEIGPGDVMASNPAMTRGWWATNPASRLTSVATASTRSRASKARLQGLERFRGVV